MYKSISRLLLFLLVCTATALCAGEGLRIEGVAPAVTARIGNNLWLPLRVRVSNSASAAQKAVITLRFDGSGQVFMREVEIPAATIYEATLPVRLQMPPQRFNALFKPSKLKQTMPDGSSREITRNTGSIDIQAALVDARTGNEYGLYKNRYMLEDPGVARALTVDDDAEEGKIPLAYREGGLPAILGERKIETGLVEIAVVPGEFLPVIEDTQQIQSAYLLSANLPEEWAGYEGVSFVFIGSHQRLNPAQQIALRRWVALGGRMVVCAARNPGAYMDSPFWEELLPVLVTGRREVMESDIGALEAAYKGGFGGLREVSANVAQAMLRAGGELLAGSADNVLFARRRIGAGEVYVPAMPGEGLRHSPGAQGMYAPVFEPQAALVPGMGERLRENALELIKMITGLPVPEKWVIAGLMLGYLILASAILIIMRLKGRGELGWPVLLVLSLIMAGVGFAVMDIGGGGQKLSSGEVGISLLPSNAAYALNRSYTGAYPFADIAADLRWRRGGMLLSPVAEGGTMAQMPTVLMNFFPRVPDLRLSPGQFRGFGADSVLPYGQGVEATVFFARDGLAGKVVNRTGAALEDCFLHINRRIAYIGNLAAGAEFNLARAELLWLEELTPRRLSSGREERYNLLTQAMYARNGGNGFNNRPLLYAFTTGAGYYDYTLNEQAVKNNANQLLAVIPDIAAPVSGAAALIEAGMCGLRVGGGMGGGGTSYYGYPREEQYLGASGGRGTRPGTVGQATRERAEMRVAFNPEKECVFPRWLEGEMQGRIIASFSVPAGVEGVPVVKAELVMRARLEGYSFVISIRRPGDEKKSRKIGVLEPAKSDQTFEIKDYAAFFGAQGQPPEFEVRINPVGGGLAAGKWDMEIFDLRLHLLNK